MVLAIMQRTGLNVKFAVECLQGNGWDVERAVVNFEQVKVRKVCIFCGRQTKESRALPRNRCLGQAVAPDRQISALWPRSLQVENSGNTCIIHRT